jgi:hypothetical protein
MLNLMLALMAAQTAPEITPSLDTLSGVTGQAGTCFGGHVQTAATLRIQWTATNYNSATQTFYVYEDGLLVDGLTGLSHTKVMSGLKENDPHHEQDYTATWTVEIRRNSDNTLLDSAQVLVEKFYGDCVPGDIV